MSWIKRLQHIRADVAKDIFGPIQRAQDLPSDILLGVAQTQKEIQQALGLGANPNNHFGMDARMIVSRLRETIDPPERMVLDLFEGGLDPHTTSPSGSTFLHECVHRDCVDILLDAEVNPCSLNRNRHTPLMVATTNGWWGSANEMMQRGFPMFPEFIPNQDKELAKYIIQMLHDCQNSNAYFLEPILKHLMPQVHLSSFSQEDRVFLFDLLSIESDESWLNYFQKSIQQMSQTFHVPHLLSTHTYSMEEAYLIACYRNADFDADVYTNEKHTHIEDLHGYTLLHYAVKNHMVTATKKLIELGADVNRPNHQGITPLMMIHEPRVGSSLFEPNNTHPDAILALMVDAGASPFEYHPIHNRPLLHVETHPPKSDVDLHRQVSLHAYNTLLCDMERTSLQEHIEDGFDHEVDEHHHQRRKL